MPYFVFSIKPLAQIRKLDEFAVFKDASARAKALRAARADGAGAIKIVFAENQQLAEDLLCQIREPDPTGDD